MIKSVTVTNHVGDTKTFILTDPDESGFIVTNIEGIGPPQADINITNMATIDGGLFNSARAQTRNIVLYLRLLPKPTVEATRQQGYKFFPVKHEVKLTFHTDNRNCVATGYVESNEPDIFSKEESVQISVVCDDPWFYKESDNITVFYGIERWFEFSFCNDSLTEKELVFGEIKMQNEKTIVYDGDEEIGVTMTIHATGEAKNITVYNIDKRETMRIDSDKLEELTGSGIVQADDIIICTEKGKKSIRLLREGVYTNILNCINKDADWFQLSKGNNTFAVVAEEGLPNLQFQMVNRSIFTGV